MLKLAQEATNLSRAIYASMPWGYRVAQLFLKVSFDSQEAFGRFAYAEFIKADVVGLPDIGDSPASDFKAKVQGRNGANHLPRGYGKSFGNKLWRNALIKLKSPEIVEEAAANVMMKIVQGKARINEGSSVNQAENYLITAVINAGKDLIKSNRRKHEVQEPEDASYEALLDDPKAFADLDKMLPQSEINEMLKKIERVHPKAAEWVKAQLYGLTNTELAAEWGVSVPRVTQLAQRFLPDVKKIMFKYLQE